MKWLAAPDSPGTRDTGCLLIGSTLDADEVAAQLDALTGLVFPLQPGAVSGGAERRVLWLGPRSWLLQCARDEERVLAARINEAFSDRHVHAVVHGDGWCWIEIAGAGAGALMAEAGFVSLEGGGLPVGHVKATIFAAIRAVVVRESQGAWLVGVERSRASYLQSWLDAARQRAAVLPP